MSQSSLAHPACVCSTGTVYFTIFACKCLITVFAYIHRVSRTPQVFKKPVIIINYPKEIKAFYMKVNPDGKVRSGRVCFWHAQSQDSLFFVIGAESF